MGLAEFQSALARLYTDTALRERFFADPQGTGAALGLNDQEVRRLAQVSAQQVHFVARALVNKRLNEARKLLPLTTQVLGQQFAALFRRHAETSIPSGTKKHRNDALAFVAFLARCNEVTPDWAADVARYEAAWLEAHIPTRRLILRRFRYPVYDIVQALMREQPATPQTRPTLALWLRFTGRGRIRHFVL